MARYFLNTGILWSDINNWSDTDGGAGGFSVPTATDDVFFTANSGPCTVNGANRVCRNFVTTGFNGTITITTIALTTAGTVTLSATTTINGSGIFAFNATCTATRNGANVAVTTVRHVTSGTVTFADTWQVVNYNCSGSAGVLNGSTLNVSGNLTLTAATGSGTTNIVLNGTGTQTWSGNFQLNNNLEINKASGNFIISGSVNFGVNNKTLKYTNAGSVTTTGSVVTVGAATFNTGSGLVFSTLNFSVAATRTLLADLYCSQLSMTGGASTTNGFNIYISANLAFATTAATICAGTTNLYLTGTGNWSHTTTGRFSNNLTIKSTAIVTCTTNPVYVSGGTFTVESGAVINSGNITFANSCTINSSAVTLATCRFNGGTFTFNEDFNCSIFNANSTTTFTFTSTTTKVINTDNFSFGAGSTINFKAGMTVNVSTSLTLAATLQSTTSSHMFFNLAIGATQNVSGVAATYVNSSGGQTIYNIGGTNTNTVNWSLTRSQMFYAFFMS